MDANRRNCVAKKNRVDFLRVLEFDHTRTSRNGVNSDVRQEGPRSEERGARSKPMEAIVSAATNLVWVIGSSSPQYDLNAVDDHGLENFLNRRVAKDFIGGIELGIDLPFTAGHRLRQILLYDGIGGPSGESAAALPFNIARHLVRHFVCPERPKETVPVV